MSKRKLGWIIFIISIIGFVALFILGVATSTQLTTTEKVALSSTLILSMLSMLGIILLNTD